MTDSRERVEVEVELDTAGVGAFLQSNDVARMVTAAANRLAASTGVEGARAHPYTTDRKAAAVSVPLEAQTRDGALTRAASAMGLRVVSKGGA